MKKTINKFSKYSFSLLIIYFTAASLCLYSCEEPSYPIENPDQYSKVFMSSAGNGAISKSFSIKDNWEKISFGAGYGGLSLLNQPITINFEVSAGELEKYNQSNNTDYELPPTESYKLTNTLVSIQPGNAGSNYANLEVNPLKLSGTKTYAIPVTIKSVEPAIPITDHLKTTFYLVNGFYETNPFTPLSQDAWEIEDFSDDDYDAVGGRAPFCIDGDVNTVWLSTYRRVNGWRPGHPHYVTIDMNESHLLHGVTIYGRLGANNAYLFPKNVLIQTSSDATSWNDVGTYTIAASTDDTSATMYFPQSITSRYLKITVLSSFGNGETTAIAEVVAF